MADKAKIVGVLIGATAGAVVGYISGLTLHDYLAYVMPLEAIKKLHINYQDYINMYNYYSNGLRELFGRIFGLIGGSFGAYFGYEITSIGNRNRDYRWRWYE